MTGLDGTPMPSFANGLTRPRLGTWCTTSDASMNVKHGKPTAGKGTERTVARVTSWRANRSDAPRWLSYHGDFGQSRNLKIFRKSFNPAPTSTKGTSDENENQLSAHWRYRALGDLLALFDGTRSRHEDIESYRNEQRGSGGHIRSGHAVGHRGKLEGSQPA